MSDGSPAQFRAALGVYADKFEGTLTKAHRALGIEALTRLVLKNPVGNPDLWQSTKDAKDLGVYGTKADTFAFARAGYVGGHSRRNWRVTDGSPATGEIDGVDDSGRETLAAGQAEIEKTKPFGVMYITNNVPYIEALENGHSTQAPAGMLNVTEAEMSVLAQSVVDAITGQEESRGGR